MLMLINKLSSGPPNYNVTISLKCLIKFFITYFYSRFQILIILSLPPVAKMFYVLSKQIQLISSR